MNRVRTIMSAVECQARFTPAMRRAHSILAKLAKFETDSVQVFKIVRSHKGGCYD
jgi:hypothetical protein